MGSTYRFISQVEEAESVLDWFRGVDPCPTEQTTEKGAVFYFREFGPLTDNPAECPVVNVFLPRKHRGILTTAGEVHFVSTPAKRFPPLAAISRQFGKWLSQYSKVYSRKQDYEGGYEYYLETDLKGLDSDIYALPGGLEALKEGRYFISDMAADGTCEDLCRQLRLRGVEGIEEAQQNNSGSPD